MNLNEEDIKVGAVLHMKDDCFHSPRNKWIVLKTPFKVVRVYGGPSLFAKRVWFRAVTLLDTPGSDVEMYWAEMNRLMSLSPSPTAVIFKCLGLLPEHQREVMEYLVCFRKPETQ